MEVEERETQADCFGSFGIVKPEVRLAGKTAQVGDQSTPQLAPLPPAVPGGVVAKPEEQRQGDAEDGERS